MYSDEVPIRGTTLGLIGSGLMTLSAAVDAPASTSLLSYKVFAGQVTGTRRLSPHMIRITFGGAELAGMTSGGLDQRIKLLLPRAGQVAPELPSGELSLQVVRQLPESMRPIVRTYTIRSLRADSHELDVDFVLHSHAGPGSAFAAAAQVGDRVGIVGPNADYPHGKPLAGVEYNVDRLHTHTLLVGDETALPAIGSILETLPSHVHAKVLLEIPSHQDRQRLISAANVDLTWLARDEHSAARGELILDALASAPLADPALYAWVCGEAGVVKAVRRHLINDRGMDRSAVSFMGYWRTAVNASLWG